MRADTLILASVVLFVAFSGVTYAQNHTSNTEFISRSFDSALEELFDEYELPDKLLLELNCVECRKDYFESKLVGFLNDRVTELYIDKDGDVLDKLKFHLYRSDFSYARSGGSLFRRGNLHRVFDVNIDAVCMSFDGRVLWQNDKEARYTEKISWEEAKQAGNRANSLFSAELPETGRSRIWEPLVISGLLGGLVYLFFASR